MVNVTRIGKILHLFAQQKIIIMRLIQLGGRNRGTGTRPFDAYPQLAYKEKKNICKAHIARMGEAHRSLLTKIY